MAPIKRPLKGFHNPDFLCGIWFSSEPGGSSDFRFVFLPSGLGSFCHFGWWRYRLVTFYWHVTPNESLQLIAQKDIHSQMPTMGPERLNVSLLPIRVYQDEPHQVTKLTLPIQDAPRDYALVSKDMRLAEQALMPDEWGICEEE